MDINLNGLTLAYIGDAYYELMVRMHLIGKHITNVNDLHKQAIRFTSGTAQAAIIYHFIEAAIITEDEVALVKRGRNASGPGRKNIDAKTYHMATGFETLIGSLYLHNIIRAEALILCAISYIEEGDFNGKDSQKSK